MNGHYTIKGEQIPIEPGCSITVHKAQRQTLRAVGDVVGWAWTRPPCTAWYARR